MSQLTAAEYEALDAALRKAFVDFNDLASAVRRSGFDIHDMASEGDRKPDYTRKVIDWVESRNSVHKLIAAARQSNPENAELLKVSAALGVEPGDPRREAPVDGAFDRTAARLERMVEGKRGISDLGSFAIRIQEVVRQVCAIEVGDEAGTGFLIGPDVVLTNYHVVQSAIAGKFDPSGIVVRFDYRRLRDGRTVDAGKEYRLADQWLVDSEPYSSVDNQPYDASNLPLDTELDYAVLRLEEPVGSYSVDFAQAGTKRGWLEPRRLGPDLAEDSFLMVVQHPCNDPISFDYANDAVVRLNPNKTRVHYRINTLPGSSGSPVLDHRLELVALHHAGEPGSPDSWLPCKAQLSEAAYNEGIPIERIVARVAENLGAASPFGTRAQSSGESQTSPHPQALEADTTASQGVAISESRRVSAGYYAASAAENPRGDGSSLKQNLQTAVNNTVGPSMRDNASLLSGSANSPPPTASPESDRVKAMRLAERRTALDALEKLRLLMDDALNRFGGADANERAKDVAADLSPQEYVGLVSDIADDLDMASPDELLGTLQRLVGAVLVGMPVAGKRDDFDAVADLAERAAGAYETVGAQLAGEQGAVLIRVAPYWAMKAAHARHRQAVVEQTRRMSASQPSGTQGDRQTVPPSEGTTGSRG